MSHNLLRRCGVKIACGLVGENKLGLVEEGARDDNALLLAAGKLVGHLMGLCDHAYFFEHLVDALFAAFAVFPARGFEDKFEVGIGGAVHQQLEILKHDAYAAAQKGDVLAAQIPKVEIEYAGLAARDGHFAVQGFQQRRLARTHAAHLAGGYAEIHILQHNVLMAQDVDALVFDNRRFHKRKSTQNFHRLKINLALLLFSSPMNEFGIIFVLPKP